MELRSITAHFIDKVWKNRIALLVFLLAMPFLNESFPTSYFVYIFVIDSFKFIAFFVLIGIYIKRKKKPSVLMLILLFSQIMWLFSTVLNYSAYSTKEWIKLFYDIFSILSLSMIVELFINEPKSLIRGLMTNYEIAIYSYVFSIVFKLAGEGYYLRGLLNTLLLWIIPSICLSLLNIVICKKYVRSICLLFACFYTVWIVKSATTIVSLFAMIMVILLGLVLHQYKRTKKFVLPLALILSVSILLNLFVLFVYNGHSFPLVDFIIKKFLNRTTDFTQRNTIWAEAIRMIRLKPLFGYGYKPVIYASTDFGTEYIHAHNQLLQKLIESGIIGLVLFTLFHMELIRKVDKSKNTVARIITVAAVFAVSITYITEAYAKFFVFYPVFFLAYYVDELVKNSNYADNEIK